jgi:hypothetical protein
MAQRGAKVDLVQPRRTTSPETQSSFGPVDSAPCRGGGRRPARGQDVGRLRQRLDVVDGGGLAEETVRHREGRLDARKAALALDGLEERRLFAADVGAGRRCESPLDAEAASRGCCRPDSPPHGTPPAPRSTRSMARVFAANVDEDARADGIGADERALEHAAGVAFEQHAVLEGARLRLVGVDDEIFGLAWRVGRALPLDPGREGCAAAPQQVGRLEFIAITSAGQSGQRLAQRLHPARSLVFDQPRAAPAPAERRDDAEVAAHVVVGPEVAAVVRPRAAKRSSRLSGATWA